MAFIIVSHILPTAHSLLAEILSRHTKMPVTVASNAMRIQANHVYVSSPNTDILIRGYSFKIVSPRTTRKHIDLFFSSLAESMGARAVGVILSGYFDDGTEGCKRIKANGGTIIAQDVSAEVDGMSLSAQASGCVDFVLPPEKIPDALRRLKASETTEKLDFGTNIFLATIGEGRKLVLFPRKQIIYAQGGPSDAVFYIQKGTVKISVVSQDGKEATISILNPADFCGEGCLAGQPLRLGTATAMTDCELLRIDKDAMMFALGREQKLSDVFTAYLLARNTRYEADLIAQLFSSS